MTPVFLNITKGCYGLQRNGDTVGPLEQSVITGQITSQHSNWNPTGAYSCAGFSAWDIIEIIPAPDKLPEPFECVGQFAGGLFYGMYASIGGRDNVSIREHYRCTVTPIERVK